MPSTTSPTLENLHLTHEEGEDEEAFSFSMQLASAAVLPMVLKSAVELDLFELIKKAGPGSFVSTTELAAQVSTANPEAHEMLDRMLRLLASYSVLACKLSTTSDGSEERVYGLTPVCKFLMKNEDGVSMAPFLLMIHDRVPLESWYHLKDAVVEGGVPFHKAYGMPTYEYFGTKPEFSKLFNEAMFSHATLVMRKIMKTYKGFEGINTLVDVGGGRGASLNMIISQYPSIKGINFDLPHVIRDAPSFPGVEHVGGDMFKSIPKGDAIFMKCVSHMLNDEDCLKLYKLCYEALPENGKLIVSESIVPEVPDNRPNTRNVLHLDMVMLTGNNGGRERTERSFHALAKAAGFKEFRKVCCAYNTWIMELLK